MANVQQQEDEIRRAAEMHRERELAFYAASLDAFYNTSLEYDKGLFALCAGGLGLLVTLLTTVGNRRQPRSPGVTSSRGDAPCGRFLPVDGRRKHAPGTVTVSKEEQHARTGR
jgi:hypothetical protein